MEDDDLQALLQEARNRGLVSGAMQEQSDPTDELMAEARRRGLIADVRQEQAAQADQRRLSDDPIARFGLESVDLAALTGEQREQLLAAGVPIPRYAPGFDTSALRGVTFGGLDEIEGAASAAGQFVANRAGDVRAAVTGQPVDPERRTAGEAFRDTQQLSDLQARQNREARPLRAAGGELLGGLVAGGPAAKGVVQGARTFAGAVGRASGAGAGFGAAAGALEAQGGAAERASGALAGAAVGGALGAGLAGLGGGVSRFLQARAAGSKAASIDKTGFEIMRNFLADDLGSRNKAEAALRKWQSSGAEPADLLDLGGPGFRTFLRDVAQDNNAKATSVVNRIVTAQADDLRGRAREMVRGVNPKQAIEAAKLQKRVLSGPAYERAYAVEIDPGYFRSEIAPELTTSTMRSSMRKAIAMAADEGDRTTAQLLRNAVNDNATTLNVKGLDYVKRGLDDVIGRTKRAGGQTRTLVAAKNRLLDRVDNVAPEYRDARNVFAGFAEVEDAFDQGADIFKMDAEEVADLVRGMNDSEKEFFRLGIARGIERRILATRDPRNKATFVNSEELRDRFRAAFGDDPAAVEDFIDYVKRSETQFLRAKEILPSNNSQTQPRQVIREKVRGAAGKATDFATNPRGFVSSQVRRVTEEPGERQIRAVYEAMGEMLFDGRQQTQRAALPAFNANQATQASVATPALLTARE
ncbi:MAG: hypothetical protein AAFR11_05640 [Pseudomonadota bacterium]